MSDDHKQGADAAEAMPMKLVPSELLGRFRELNPSNYDHDDVCAINAWGVEVCLAAAAPADAGESRVPAGFKLVPAEPTPEMVAAAFVGCVEPQDFTAQQRSRQRMAEFYRAMLAAAPEAPTTPLPAAEEVGQDRVPKRKVGLATIEVVFIVDGRRHKIEVPDAPTLTASAFALKSAAGVPITHNFAIVQPGIPDRTLRDAEAVVLDPVGTTEFNSWPQGLING